MFNKPCKLVRDEHKVIPIFPPKHRICDPRRDIPTLLAVGPLPVLYQHLIPSKKKGRVRPPVVRCGFMAKREFFFGYARDHGLIQEGLQLEEEGEGGVPVVMVYDTLVVSIRAILAELQISSIPIRLEYTITRDAGTLFITLCSNYSMKRMPPVEDVQKLARFLGQEPMWCFDSTHWRWT